MSPARIKTARSRQGMVRIRGKTQTPVSPEVVALALGGTPAGRALGEALDPVTLMALRQELAARLGSSGGRPGFADTSKRAKIPLSDADWHALERLAAGLEVPGFRPSAGQVASVLLKLSIRAVEAHRATDSPVSRERRRS